MVHFKEIAPGHATSALKRMLKFGARLPAEECSDRITRWSK
jgi:hypothetical protein